MRWQNTRGRLKSFRLSLCEGTNTTLVFFPSFVRHQVIQQVNALSQNMFTRVTSVSVTLTDNRVYKICRLLVSKIDKKLGFESLIFILLKA